jgi:hypothetical protein
MHSITSLLTAVLVGASGLVTLAVPPAEATAQAATMRQLAGAIPNPFYAREVGAIAVTGDSLFAVDNNGIMRADLVTHDVWQFAGDPVASGSGDGPALSARFHGPDALASDGLNLYVLDGPNDTVRRIDVATGEVTTLAGTAGMPGSADGIGAAARFNSPRGMALDGAGENLDVSDQCAIRRIVVATRAVTTIVGMAGQCGVIDGIGQAARIGEGELTEDSGVLWMAEYNCIRKVRLSTLQATTLACPGDPNWPQAGITSVGPDVYVVKRTDDTEDETTDLVRVKKGSGAISPSPEPPYPVLSRHLARDGSRFWVSGDRQFGGEPLFTVDPGTGTVANPLGFGQEGTLDGTGMTARLTTGPLTGMATDGTNLYVSDESHDRIRKVVAATGVTSTFVPVIVEPKGGTVVGNDLFVASDNSVKRVALATGAPSAFATVGMSNRDANDIASDGTNLYVTSDDCAVYRVVIATAAVTVLAGSPGQCGNVDAVGTAARLGACCGQHGPKGITIDGGNLYLADRANEAIRKIDIATGAVTTFIGHGGPLFYDAPLDVVTDGTDLYVSDGTGIFRAPLATAVEEPITGTFPSITYRPQLVSATRPYEDLVLESGLALGAGGHHLYFTNRTGVGVITDAKVPPQLSVGDATVTEGDSGTGLAVFTVRLSSPQPDPVSVDFFTVDGTATTAGGDYVAASGRLDFAPGVVEKPIRVTINGDTADEVNEKFKVRLASPTGGATLSRAAGKGKILDDDPGGAATLSVGDVTVVEGDDLTAGAVFSVRLSASQPVAVSMNFGTSDGSATGGDYVARLGTITIPAGTTSKNISVQVSGDYDAEALETFTLTISGSSGPSIRRATGTGSIIDDE